MIGSHIFPAHERAVKEANIIHRDISIRNLMIHYPNPADPFSSNARPRGLLIDFDYGRPLRKPGQTGDEGKPQRDHSAADRTASLSSQ